MATSTRTPLMAGNWKMNLNHHEAVHLVQKLALGLADKKHDFGAVEVVVVPPFTDIRSVQTTVDGGQLAIKYGAQDISTHDDGAYTGEISAAMLAKLGCSYVVVGHSERREYHGETDALVNTKAHKALGAGITPIVCVGEGLEIRQAGTHVEYTVEQLDGSLAGFTPAQVAELVVAYEPVWAIGTGEVATPEDAQEVCAALRARISEVFGEDAAAGLRILYGGSVKANNVAGIMQKPDVDGALVGGASLQADEFGGICRFYSMPVLWPVMNQPRSVVITGASRGLGFASATYLYEQGWQVVAAMRSVGPGLAALQEATGASADDPRLIGIRLDLLDTDSVAGAAEEILTRVGAPFAVVHNAGIAAAGTVEELPADVWRDMFGTHLFGPVALTKALLPAMREAGRGRIVMISSAGGVRGMPIISAYSAAKGAVERWAESLAAEVSPFGIGVSVLVTGVFDTDIITDAGTADYLDFEGPYGPQNATLNKRGRAAVKIANSPEKFAVRLASALDDYGPYAKHAVGADSVGLMTMARILPSKAVHQVIRLAMGQPRHGSIKPPGRAQ